jgi:hypothetical protein
MRNKTKGTQAPFPVVGVLTVLAFLLFVPDSGQAQSQVLFACYVPRSGVVYRIKEPGLHDACRARKHVEFSWRVDPAPLNYIQVQGPVVNLPIGGSAVGTGRTGTTGNVECPSGTRVVGGGSEIVSSQFPNFFPFLVESRPSSATEWLVQFVHIGGSTSTFTWGVVVHLICL